jgi:hypothetical protein
VNRPVLVGCPTADRTWIIDQWLNHVVRAASVAEVDVEVVLLGPPGDGTLRRAVEQAALLDVPLYWRDSDEKPGTRARALSELGAEEHLWPDERLKKMVGLRNQLLREVRSRQPELFLSIDSDVLLHERALAGMIGLLRGRRYAAVGSKTHLSPHSLGAPNYANLSEDGRLCRRDVCDVLEVGVLMALKLMRPNAYNVDYAFDGRGEDVGWSLSCKRGGLRLAWDGRFCSRHVMRRV